MVQSTRHKKIQQRTVNCKGSLWTWVGACPGFVADVTDPFDHDSSETMGHDWQSNTCPTPLKSPKFGTQTMTWVPRDTETVLTTCTLTTNVLKVCAIVVWDTQGSVWSQKHGMCKWKMHFLYVDVGEKQHLPQYAANALFVQDKPVKKSAFTSATRAEKRSEAHSYVNQSQKNLYSTTSRRFAKLPKPMTLQISKKSAGSTTVQHPFRGLEPQIPRPKHQALAPSLPMSLPPKLMFVTVLLTFNASARACGQKRW